MFIEIYTMSAPCKSLAQVFYESYCKSVGGLGYDGKSLKSYDELPPRVKIAYSWAATARVYNGDEHYNTYCWIMGGKTMSGTPCPLWSELSDKVQTAWDDASEAADKYNIFMNASNVRNVVTFSPYIPDSHMNKLSIEDYAEFYNTIDYPKFCELLYPSEDMGMYTEEKWDYFRFNPLNFYLWHLSEGARDIIRAYIHSKRA